MALFLRLMLALPLVLNEALAEPFVLPLTRRPGMGKGEQRRLTTVDEARVFGNLYQLFSYHVDVLVGTPGQMQSLIVDTGSDTTAFACTTCGSNCGRHLDQPFDPQSSSTFRWVRCGGSTCPSGQCPSGVTDCLYNVSYEEGSRIEGKYFEDTCHVGHAQRRNSNTRVVLGCHTRETNMFLAQAPSGIMGLASTNWDMLTALMGGQQLNRKVLGLCLSDEGGIMTVGGVNESWTPLGAPLQEVSFGAQYSVSVTGATMTTSSNQLIQLATLAGTYALDSGSTFTYLFPSQANALRDAVRTACGGASACGSAVAVDSACWRATAADIAQFPDLRIAMGRATYVWQAKGYLYDDNNGKWCYSFRDGVPLVLGASFMRHHLVVFDRDNSKVRFAPSTCPQVRQRSDSVPLYTTTLAPTPAPTPPPATTTTGSGETATSKAASTSTSVAALLALLSLAAARGLAA